MHKSEQIIFNHNPSSRLKTRVKRIVQKRKPQVTGVEFYKFDFIFSDNGNYHRLNQKFNPFTAPKRTASRK